VTVKKLAFVLIAAALLAAVAVPGLAFANNGPHGGYVADTDMCAQCHRAHTAPSTITWTDNQGAQKNALLITDSAQTYLFCLACHDTASQGADTNVMGGVYEGTAYGAPGGDLISGAFGSVGATAGALYDAHGVAVTSTHLMNGQSWGAYGGGSAGDPNPAHATGDSVTLLGTGNKIVMDCTTCHDPHGSSNYRLLKDVVNGNSVGGYTGSGANPTPNPYVISDETGYPQGGFLLHTPAVGYVPNYTTAQYAQAPGGDANKGMSGWCAGCHTTYMVADQAPITVNGATVVPNGSSYNSGDGLGLIARHRHPINVALSTYQGTQNLITDSSLGLPLAHPTSQKGAVSNSSADWIDCLTCHNAHGSTATMSGWADLGLPATEDVVGSRGVMPVDSNLLKMDNRGVCEACHNK
jgi:hypothetical protein